jgi:hypothetical protein
MVEAGQPLPVEVRSVEEDRNLALHLLCHDEKGEEVGEPELMRAIGDGRYQGVLADLPEGAYRVTVQSASPAVPIDAVSDWTIVLDVAKAQ